MAGPRYEALVKLAAGGMATVWIGTARGALGFRQLVAIKKPHPHLLEQEGFREELIAEARLASMIRHANVVDVRDVEEDAGGISLVMDYIEGASLGELLVAASRRGPPSPRLSPRVAVRILRDACAGLHAAHELVDEKRRPVGLIHRDISPHNKLVGEYGIARVTDFGVAKFARKNMASTSAGSLKGKLAYMPPEYLRSEPIDRRFDVFGAGIVLWESLTGQRCFRGDSEADTFRRILETTPAPVSTFVPALAPLDDVVATALAKSPDARFQNAAAMGAALETAATESGLFGSHTEVAASLKELLGPLLDERRERVRTKLVNEPSLASMNGEQQSPLAPQTEAVPTTEPQAETTVTTEAAAPTTEPSRGPPTPLMTPDTRGGTLGMATPLPSPDLTPRTLGSAGAMTPHTLASVQPVTSSAYEIEPPLPTKKFPLLPVVLASVVLAGLAVAGGMTLGRAHGPPASSLDEPEPMPAPAASPQTTPPATATPAPVLPPPSSLAATEPRPASPPKTKPSIPKPSTSTKRPPANPYE